MIRFGPYDRRPACLAAQPRKPGEVRCRAPRQAGRLSYENLLAQRENAFALLASPQTVRPTIIAIRSDVVPADAANTAHPPDPRPAVFLDRDDTLIACRDVTPDGDLGDPALVRLLPGVKDACAALKAAGWFLAVVSNQGGVARGKYGLDQVDACNQRLNELLGPAAAVDAFRFCPYHPSGVMCGLAREHPWRKPAPGMLLDLAQHHAIDLADSWMVGDAERDIEAGLAAGCRTIRVGPDAREPSKALHRVPGVQEAAAIILAHSPRAAEGPRA